jgi:hypothetical protein
MSDALSSSSPYFTLGIGEASDVLSNPYGTGVTNMLQGQSVDASAVLIRYTYAGDGNLNGYIDGPTGTTNTDRWRYSNGSTGFAHADFDYNGTNDADDFFLLTNNVSYSSTHHFA